MGLCVGPRPAAAGIPRTLEPGYARRVETLVLGAWKGGGNAAAGGEAVGKRQTPKNHASLRHVPLHSECSGCGGRCVRRAHWRCDEAATHGGCCTWRKLCVGRFNVKIRHF